MKSVIFGVAVLALLLGSLWHTDFEVRPTVFQYIATAVWSALLAWRLAYALSRKRNRARRAERLAESSRASEHG